jgi:hypothetical protein
VAPISQLISAKNSPSPDVVCAFLSDTECSPNAGSLQEAAGGGCRLRASEGLSCAWPAPANAFADTQATHDRSNERYTQKIPQQLAYPESLFTVAPIFENGLKRSTTRDGRSPERCGVKEIHRGTVRPRHDSRRGRNRASVSSDERYARPGRLCSGCMSGRKGNVGARDRHGVGSVHAPHPGKASCAMAPGRART